MILRFLIEKEFKQMMRNIVLPLVYVLLPLAMMNMVPRAATQEVKNLNICVVDNDHSPLSARLVAKLSASSYFHLVSAPPTYGKGLEQMESGEADFVLEIEQGFERHLITEQATRVNITANAVNGVKAGLGSSYLAQIVADYALDLSRETGTATAQAGFDVAPRFLFNTALDYKLYMIPGLMGMLLILIVGFLPALNIVGEKEKGTIEQMNVTPVGRGDFILSKLIPYWAVGLAILAYAMLLAWAIYGFWPKGSLAALFLFASVFVLLVSSLGIIVSNYSDTTQQAALVMFFFLIIFVLMSGLITPVSSMPGWARAITCVNPLRYFLEAIRALYIKGSSVRELVPQLSALLVYAGLLWLWAIRSYRKNS